MVARIKTPVNIKRPLNYNEIKVNEGKAELLHASGFLKDAAMLNFYDKLQRFQGLISLNERAKTNSLHISLNFDPSEKLSKETLREIADVYMDKIGFAKQPYLVYQHHDSGHPHLHIVTTTIKPDGKRIDTYNIGRNQSEKARKEIEQSYRLVRATGRKQTEQLLKPVNVQKVQYGKSDTRKAITNVLDTVLDDYKYASLPELNAVLRQYNILAERGGKESRIYINNGLVYRILDEHGNPVGVPIKASLIYNQPTLKKLEEKFKGNQLAREPFKRRVKTAIDFALLKSADRGLANFTEALRKEGIITVLRQNDQGLIYGITYVDAKYKCVFNGSALGKQYSANAIQQRCQQKAYPSSNEQAIAGDNKTPNVDKHQPNEDPIIQNEIHAPDLLKTLMQPGSQGNFVDPNFKKKPKRKRRPTGL